MTGAGSQLCGAIAAAMVAAALVGAAGQGQSPGVSVKVRMSRSDNLVWLRLPKNNSLGALFDINSKLVELHLTNFSGWTSADLLDLGKFTNMRTLYLLNYPDNLNGDWIRRLHWRLTELVITGPGTPRWLEHPDIAFAFGLSVTIRNVTRSHLDRLLPALNDTVRCLHITDCPQMAFYDLYTLENLTRLTWLSLYRLNTLSDNFHVGLYLLYSLSRLSQLSRLRLGSPDSRYWKQISTSAYGVVKVVKECTDLSVFYINTNLTTMRSVLDGLKDKNLGLDNIGRRRYIYFMVPNPVFDDLTKSASSWGQARVRKWEWN